MLLNVASDQGQYCLPNFFNLKLPIAIVNLLYHADQGHLCI